VGPRPAKPGSEFGPGRSRNCRRSRSSSSSYRVTCFFPQSAFVQSRTVQIVLFRTRGCIGHRFKNPLCFAELSTHGARQNEADRSGPACNKCYLLATWALPRLQRTVPQTKCDLYGATSVFRLIAVLRATFPARRQFRQ